MPTQRLIDINTAAITYRRECLTALGKRQYKSCIGAIKTLNAELPRDDGDHKYRIVFDTDAYNNKVNEHFQIICPKCEVEHEYRDIKFYDLDLPIEERIISDISRKRYWKCPKCKEENELTKSDVIQSAIEKPYYLRVVPDPPSIDNGLVSKLVFHNQMVEWVWLCLNSLEDGFARFRDDNWNKQSEEEELYLDTSVEEASN